MPTRRIWTAVDPCLLPLANVRAETDGGSRSTPFFCKQAPIARGVIAYVLAIGISPALAMADLVLKNQFELPAGSLTNRTAWIAQHDGDPGLELVNCNESTWLVIDLSAGTQQAVIAAPWSGSFAKTIKDSDGDGLDEVLVSGPDAGVVVEGVTTSSVFLGYFNYYWDPNSSRDPWLVQTDADSANELLVTGAAPGDLRVIDIGTGLVEDSYEFASQPFVETVTDVDGDGLNEIVVSCQCSPGVDVDRVWYVFDTTGPAASIEDDFGALLPAIHLQLTAPEPTDSDVRIDFALAQSEPVSIRIIDVTGRLVRAVADDLPFQAGQHRMTWNGTDRDGHDAPSGVYFVQVATKERTDSRRITLVRCATLLQPEATWNLLFSGSCAASSLRWLAATRVAVAVAGVSSVSSWALSASFWRWLSLRTGMPRRRRQFVPETSGSAQCAQS